MNLSAIYSKTGKGARALASKSKDLPDNAMHILSYINGKASVEIIISQLPKISEEKFPELLLQLVNEGYIKEIGDNYLSQSLLDFDIHSPIEVAEISAEEFMKIEYAADIDNEAIIREKTEAEARAQAYAEQQSKLQAEALQQQEAERRLLNVTDILAKSGDALDIERLAANEPRLSPKEAEEKARARHKARKRKAAADARFATEQHEQAEAKANQEKLLETNDEITNKSELEQKEQQAIDTVEQRAKEASYAQARHEAQIKLTQEAELAVALKQQQAAERLQQEAAARATERIAREARAQAQREAKEAAEIKARQDAAERVQREAQRQARIDAEKLAKAEGKAREKAATQAEHDANLKLRVEQLARQETETKLRAEAKALAQRETEQQARVAAEIKMRQKAEGEQRSQIESAIKEEAKREAKHLRNVAALTRAEEKARLKAARPSVNYALLSGTSAIMKKALAIIGVTALLLLVFLPFINLVFLIDPTQEIASQSINETVVIKEVNVLFWPKPHLVLDNISIGNTSDIKTGPIKLFPVFSTLVDKTKVFEKIEIEALAFDEKTVERPIDWLGKINQSGQLRVSLIKLNKSILTWQGATQLALDSEIAFTEAGKWQKTILTNATRNLQVEITPFNNAHAIAITATNWEAFIGPPIVFDALKAQGIYANGALELHHIEAQLYNGKLKGLMTISGFDNWIADGKFEIRKMDFGKSTTIATTSLGIKGQLDSNVVFSAQADDLAQLFNKPILQAQFTSTHGALTGLDLMRAIHADRKERSLSGSTAFDSFTGNLALENNQYRFTNLAFKANQLQAQGELDVFANQEISGKIDIRLAVKSRTLQSRIYLTGSVTQPLLK